MKIIAGTAKGRWIITPKTKALRPTLARVKESTFNIIGDKIINATILDLYAGSGSMGIEALSRGAKMAIFIERHYPQVKAIRESLNKFGFEEAGNVYSHNVFYAIKHLLKRQMIFDIIYLAPPFLKEMIMPTLSLLADGKLIEDEGMIIAEHHRKELVPTQIQMLELIRQRRFGDIITSFFHCNSSVSNMLKLED